MISLSLVIAGEQGVPDLKMKIKNFSVNVGGREATGWKTKLSLSPMIVGVRGVTVWNSKFTNDDVAVSGISAAEGVRNVLLLGGAPLFGISMMTYRTPFVRLSFHPALENPRSMPWVSHNYSIYFYKVGNRVGFNAEIRLSPSSPGPGICNIEPTTIAFLYRSLVPSCWAKG